jgi:3-mercaptopyruvate sulfurtransferase SseA
MFLYGAPFTHYALQKKLLQLSISVAVLAVAVHGHPHDNMIQYCTEVHHAVVQLFATASCPAHTTVFALHGSYSQYIVLNMAPSAIT